MVVWKSERYNLRLLQAFALAQWHTTIINILVCIRFRQLLLLPLALSTSRHPASLAVSLVRYSASSVSTLDCSNFPRQTNVGAG